MSQALVVPLILVGLWASNMGAQEPKVARGAAVAVIMRLGGSYKIDKDRFGQPIVEVDLSLTKADDTDMEAIEKQSRIHTLYLSNTMISDSGLNSIGKLAQLESLTISRTKTTNVGVCGLKRASEMRYLDLNGTKVTDGAIESLREMRNLSHLCLANTKSNRSLSEK